MRWEGGRECDGGQLSAPGPSGGRGGRQTERKRLIKTVLKLTCKSASLRHRSLGCKEKTGCLELFRKPAIHLSLQLVLSGSVVNADISRINSPFAYSRHKPSVFFLFRGVTGMTAGKIPQVNTLKGTTGIRVLSVIISNSSEKSRTTDEFNLLTSIVKNMSYTLASSEIFSMAR